MADNTTVLTGPNLQQVSLGATLVQPTGGTQASLADMLGGKSAVPALNVGNVTVTGMVFDSIQNSITAGTTQTLAGGTKLSAGICVVTKVGTAGDALTLPASSPGQSVWVFNQGASAAAVFPGEAATSIDAGTTAASVTLTNAKNAVFINNTSTTWISAQGGAKSS